MLLRRSYDPWGSWRGVFSDMERLRQEMDRVMRGSDWWEQAGQAAGVYPLVNLQEDKDRFVISAEVPGVDPEDIEINVLGKNLAISGERKPPQAVEGARFHRRERSYPKFSRALVLPSEVDGDQVEARCVNGILTITLPKAEAAKPRQIKVSA